MAGVPQCFLWLCHSAYGILVPRPWIKLLTPALEAQSPNYRTIREIPGAPTPPTLLPRWKSSAGHLGQTDFSSGRVGKGTLASVISPSPAGLARGLVKAPASAQKEGDLPLTWALSVSV